MTNIELWKSIILCKGLPFQTVRGIPFTYSVTRCPGKGGRHYGGESVEGFGNEIWIETNGERRKKSISRSTVELAYQRMSGGEIVGPRALGLPGAGSYLYPVLTRILSGRDV